MSAPQDLSALRNQLREEEIKLVKYHVENDGLKANKAAKNSSAAGGGAAVAAAKKKTGKTFSADELADIQRAFDEFDTDKTNTISLNELIALSKRLGVEMSDKKGKAAMEALDTNKDGVLSFEEFVAWWGESNAETATTLLAVKSKLKARQLLNKFTRSLNITPDPKEDGMKAAVTANVGGGGTNAKSNTYINLSLIPTDSTVFYASVETKGISTLPPPREDDSSDDSSDSSGAWASSSDSDDEKVADEAEKDMSPEEKAAAKAAKASKLKIERDGIRMISEVKVGLTTAAKALSKETLADECNIINGVITSISGKISHFMDLSTKPSEDGAQIIVSANFYGLKHDRLAASLAKATKKSGGVISKPDAILREATLDVEFNSDISDSLQVENGAPIAALFEGVTISAMANVGPIISLLFQLLPLRGRGPLLSAIQAADIKHNFSNLEELKEFVIQQIAKLPVGTFETYPDSDSEEEDTDRAVVRQMDHDRDVKQLTEILRRQFQCFSTITLGEIMCENLPLHKAAIMPKCSAAEQREWQNWEEPDESKWVTPSDDEDDDAASDSSIDSDDQSMYDVANSIEHFLSLLESVDELTVQHLSFMLSMTAKNFNVFNLTHASNRPAVVRANRLSLRRKYVKGFAQDEDTELGDIADKLSDMSPPPAKVMKMRYGVKKQFKIE